jgi:hypothetical protein
VDKYTRFLFAFTRGASLVVPMLITILNQNLGNCLTATSYPWRFVLFAAIVSLGFEASNENTLAATAIYAAVLVVLCEQARLH